MIDLFRQMKHSSRLKKAVAATCESQSLAPVGLCFLLALGLPLAACKPTPENQHGSPTPKNSDVPQVSPVENQRTDDRRSASDAAIQAGTKAMPPSEPAAFAPTFVDIPVREPSGVAYHPRRKTLFVVCDQGEFVEMELDYTVLQRVRLRGDLEGIAIHPVTGTLYIASESAGAIYEYGLEERRVLRTLAVDFASHPDFAGGVGRNKGLEGVAVTEVEDQLYRLYAVVQATPARLVALSADLSIPTIRQARRRIIGQPLAEPIRTSIQIVASHDLGLKRMSGVTFDPLSRMLVVISAGEGLARSCDLSGRVHRSVKIPGRKPEGVCFLPDGTAILAQDTGGAWVCPKMRTRLTDPEPPEASNRD